MNEIRRPGLPALTGLRFFAALMVVGVHFGYRVLPGAAGRIAGTGAVGVTFFFVLSGFILAYNYLDFDRRQLRGARISFLLARFARIYPIYLVSLALGIGPLIWAAAENHHAIAVASVAVPNLTLTEAWVPSWISVLNGPAWSLSAESFFYALFPWILGYCGRCTARRLLVTVSGAWLCSLVFAGLYQVALPHSTEWSDVTLYNPIARLPEFIVGVALGVLYIRQRAANWQLPASSFFVTASMALIGVLLYALAGLPHEVLFTGLLAPCFGLVIYAVAWERGLLARVLAMPILVILGEASYSLYLIHVSIWYYLMHISGRTLVSADYSLTAFLTYLLLTVLLAVLLFRYVETPCRRWIRSLFRAQRQSH